MQKRPVEKAAEVKAAVKATETKAVVKAEEVKAEAKEVVAKKAETVVKKAEEFMTAELAFCRLLQKINFRLVGGLNFEVGFVNER